MSKRKPKKLRVFEAFAGIGAQSTALKRIGVDYEVVGISDWFIDALNCYDALHNDEEINIPSMEEQLEYLSHFTFSRDSVTPYDIKNLSDKEITQLYISNKRNKNFGSITDINGELLPKIDLLVYSFPCQDLSTGGKCLGMKKGSGTRSGLLWEIERILLEMQKANNLPKFLLMENVKNILSPKNKVDMKEWLNFLETLGYSNDECVLLNAKDFGVPQDRVRAFIVSARTKEPLKIKDKLEYQTIGNSLDFFRNDFTNPTYRKEAEESKLNKTPSRNKMWDINGMDLDENTIVKTITCNMDRTHCAALFDYTSENGDSFYRRPTIREAFLLMGFTEEEYEKTLKLNYSYRKMNKLIGNSIVVNVLSAIFKAMLLKTEFDNYS